MQKKFAKKKLNKTGICENANISEKDIMENLGLYCFKNTNGNTTLTALNDCSGKPVYIPSYVGRCKSEKSCLGKTEFIRVCMYEDGLDPNVLEFEPVIVL